MTNIERNTHCRPTYRTHLKKISNMSLPFFKKFLCNMKKLFKYDDKNLFYFSTVWFRQLFTKKFLSSVPIHSQRSDWAIYRLTICNGLLHKYLFWSYKYWIVINIRSDKKKILFFVTKVVPDYPLCRTLGCRSRRFLLFYSVLLIWIL